MLDEEVFYGKVIVPCAVIVNENNQVFVQSVKDNKKTDGLWEFPGGKVRHNSCILKELVREVKEEIDIAISEDDLVPITFNVFKSQLGLEYMVMFFLCTKWQGAVKAKENQDTLWVDVQNIHTLPFLSQNKRVVKDILYFLQKES